MITEVETWRGDANEQRDFCFSVPSCEAVRGQLIEIGGLKLKLKLKCTHWYCTYGPSFNVCVRNNGVRAVIFHEGIIMRKGLVVDIIENPNVRCKSKRSGQVFSPNRAKKGADPPRPLLLPTEDSSAS